MNPIRPAKDSDVCRLAEIEVFNYRLSFYPIFQNDEFYFKEYTTEALIENYRMNPEMIEKSFVFDDGCVKGFMRVADGVVQKLFVEPILQGKGIGDALLTYAIHEKAACTLWALEKNFRAIAFYEKHGFSRTCDKMLEEDTDEYLIRLERR